MFSRLRRILALFAIATMFCSPVHALPIPFLGGTLDASLSLYDVKVVGGSRSFVWRKDYVAGVDFIAGIPGTFGVSFPERAYTAALANPTFLLWDNIFSQPPPSGCTLGAGWSFQSLGAGAATRGDCTFIEKWSNLETRNAVGGILFNNVPGLPIGLFGINYSVSIPFFLVTQEVGAELVRGSFGTSDSDELYKDLTWAPVIMMSVSWMPAADVPEPGTLALLGLSLVLLTFRRRKSIVE